MVMMSSYPIVSYFVSYFVSYRISYKKYTYIV